MADCVPLSVKWGKETVSLSFVVAGGVKGLKTELEEKTGVPADRMKLMAKSKGLWKGVLKDDFDLATIDFAAALSKANGKALQLLLMGSATNLTAPKTKTIFIEDLPPEEVAKVKEPSGLVNLGNTCYLNSVLQCLRVVPQLRKGLERYSGNNNIASAGHSSSNSGSNGLFITSLRDTFHGLDRTAEAVPPTSFLRVTRMAFPQFARLGPNGHPMQQDAEEFFSGLLTIVANELSGKENIQKGFSADVADDELKGASNLVDAVFGLKMEETITCDEFDASEDDKMKIDGDGETGETREPEQVVEAPVKNFDLHRKLVCNIQGGSDVTAQMNVSHIAEGISLSLNGKIEKHSEVLGRDAVWTRKQRIARLPPVIAVQFGRFFWKETPDSQDHAGVKCKVMKPVAFSGTLDLYDFCTEEIQAVLKVARDRAIATEEDRINKKLKGELDTEEHMKMETDDAKAVANAAAEDDEQAALEAALAMSLEKPDTQPPVGPGLPGDFQGIYELFAVVTHKGRDADGGHYMAWVKADNTGRDASKIPDTDEQNEDWFVFDDDEVSPCKTEDVLKLKGGGDWHMSYLNFYRAKK